VIWATDKPDRSKSEIAQAYGIPFSSILTYLKKIGIQLNNTKWWWCVKTQEHMY